MKRHITVGKVILVGAGPGDPDLMTVKGRRSLEKADVVVYDRLVSQEVLQFASDTAEKIFVGKKGGYYEFPQGAINLLLAEKARQGKQVVRLKGGDSFVFGRGGEEALFLSEAGIPFEVIPGVSSAFSVPAAAGIPVTHRELSSSVAVITGCQSEDAAVPVRWDQLATAADTLVVLMPGRKLKHIVAQLVLHGRSFDTPAALIESGTLESQRRVIATLRNIEAEATRNAIRSPALLVVGQVVSLAEKLAPENGLAELETVNPAGLMRLGGF